jgi:hypothetical protein
MVRDYAIEAPPDADLEEMLSLVLPGPEPTDSQRRKPHYRVSASSE